MDKRTAIERQKDTIAFMIGYYCGKKHGRAGPCEDCAGLRDYALARLDGCPFGERKPSCARCRIHCYAGSMRQSIREVMRFVGPRMLYLMPLEFMRHLRAFRHSGAS